MFSFKKSKKYFTKKYKNIWQSDNNILRFLLLLPDYLFFITTFCNTTPCMPKKKAWDVLLQILINTETHA